MTEVVFGWFGPGDPDHPEFGGFWRGASLALDEENAAGGYCRRGVPGLASPVCRRFRLVPAWSESPWKTGISDVLRVVYDRRAWAVIGGVDGTTTHLAVQVALKSRFLLLSPGSTDVSTDRANVPWLFSLPPSDEALALVIVDALSGDARAGGLAIVASTDHAAHATLVAVRRELERRRVAPSALVEIDPAEAEARVVAAHVVQGTPRNVLVLASARLSGSLVAALREAGFTGTIAGGPSTAGRAFLKAAGSAAEGVLAPVSLEPGPAWDAFAAAYERRWNEPPDEAAANGHDAVRLVAAAVRRAGLNRARIRDAVNETGRKTGSDPVSTRADEMGSDPVLRWSGAGGTIRWDPLGRNQRPVRLGRWTGGRLVEMTR